MKILYLCNKKYWNRKMSRGRFHYVRAIGEHPDMKVVCDGPGFAGFETADMSEKKHQPDFVFWYKPLEITGYMKIMSKKIISYNEMFDRRWTLKEIDTSRSDIVICHHQNDIPYYVAQYPKPCGDGSILSPHFYHIPHCSDTQIFREYGLPKKYDVAVIGAQNPPHYPLRNRLAKLMKKMPGEYRCVVHEHPGYEQGDAYTDKYAVEYAKFINQCKICCTCSGKPRSLYAKYIEVPMCGTALAADLPGQNHEALGRFMIRIDSQNKDDEIISKLCYYIEHEAERKVKVETGKEWARQHTTQKYAQMFYDVLKEW